MAKFPAPARSLSLRVDRAAGLGGGLQIVKDQTRQVHRVMEGGRGNSFPNVLCPEPASPPWAGFVR